MDPASIKWRDDIPEKTAWFLPTRKQCLEDIRSASELFSSHIFLKIPYGLCIKCDTTGSAQATGKDPQCIHRRHACSVFEQHPRGCDAGREGKTDKAGK